MSFPDLKAFTVFTLRIKPKRPHFMRWGQCLPLHPRLSLMSRVQSIHLCWWISEKAMSTHCPRHLTAVLSLSVHKALWSGIIIPLQKRRLRHRERWLGQGHMPEHGFYGNVWGPLNPLCPTSPHFSPSDAFLWLPGHLSLCVHRDSCLAHLLSLVLRTKRKTGPQYEMNKCI